MFARVLCALLLVAPYSFAQPATTKQAASDQLKMVVILTRHGVRSPTSSLQGYGDKDWPNIQTDWHVTCCGDLTPRGEKLLNLLGDYYRRHYAEKGLLPERGCPADSVYIWADNEERTIGTANALAKGFLRGMVGCRIPIESRKYKPPSCPNGCTPTPDNLIDSWFHPLPKLWGKVQGPYLDQLKKVVDKLNDPFKYQDLLTQYALPLQALQTTLGCCSPPLCSPSCKLIDLAHTAEIGEKNESGAIKWPGPLAVGSTSSEVFLLEFANDMPCDLVGWHNVLFKDSDCSIGQPFLEMQKVHTAYFNLVQQSQVVAQIQGSNLAYQIFAELSRGRQHLPRRPRRKLMIFSGHDTNIANVAGLLGLSWHMTDLPDNDTPPGGALVFELYSGPSALEYSVRVNYVYQSIKQLRSPQLDSKHEAPTWIPLQLPGCDDKCNWRDFTRIMLGAIKSDFVTPGPN